MPPFFYQRFKSVGQHRFPQDHTVLILFFRNLLVVRMGKLPEIIEGAAHVRFFFRGHIEQGQVYRAAPAVAGVFRYVTLGEQHVFCQFRIKIGFHAGIFHIFGPADEMGNRHLGTVGVVYF